MTRDGADMSRGLEGRLLGGKYRLGRVLGKGGMGIVFEAEHVGLGRRVAVKIVRPGRTPSQTELERFHLEARSAARVAGDGVVQILDIDYDAELGPYHVLELLVGEPLRERLRRGPMSPREAIDVMVQLLDTLERVHEAGIVHRDIKPGNVFLQADGRVKVLDFGVVSVRDPALLAQKLTVPGAMPGTPGYMAPEQMKDGLIDRRADIFAVAQLLYACLAGKPPFYGLPQSQVISRTIAGETVSLRADRPGLPERLYQAFERAGAHDLSRRTPTAAAFAAELRAASAELEADAIASVPITPPSGIPLPAVNERAANVPTIDSSASHGAPSQWSSEQPRAWAQPAPSPAWHQSSLPGQQWQSPASSMPPGAIPPTRGTAFDRKKKKKKSGRGWLAIPVVVLLAAAIGVGVWLYLERPWERARSARAIASAPVPAEPVTDAGAIDAALAAAQADVEHGERSLANGLLDDALSRFDAARAALGEGERGTERNAMLARAHLGRGDVFVARMDAAGRAALTPEACAAGTAMLLSEATNAYRPVFDNAFGEYTQCAAQRHGRMYETLYAVCGRDDATRAPYLDQMAFYYDQANRPGPCQAAASEGYARVRALRP